MILDFVALRELIISRPKRPVQARIVERTNTVTTRSAFVIYDGHDAWYVDDGSRQELNLGSSAVFVEGGEVQRITGRVSANNWVKSMIAGHLVSGFGAGTDPDRSDATGSVIGTERVLGLEWLRGGC